VREWRLTGIVATQIQSYEQGHNDEKITLSGEAAGLILTPALLLMDPR